MRVAITGASGFVGQAVSAELENHGHTVVQISRSPKPDGLRWDVDAGFERLNALGDIDAVIHLAGENIAGGRWSRARKQRIRASREQGTRRVVEAIEAASPRPRVLVSMSGVGYYGVHDDEELDETAPAGDDFLAGVCKVWEQEATVAEALGVRVVRLRGGVVLGKEGGALEKMLPAFKLGVGGRLGSGDQYMSWIHLDDAVGVIVRALTDISLTGVYNLTAPQPVTNSAFTDALGDALGRPTVLPAPAFALRLALGEMADALLLGGQRAVPHRLQQLGYDYTFPSLKAAFNDILG